MPRNGSGVYSLPVGSIVTDGIEDILASQHNSPLQDLEADMNAVRPIVAGGTGASSASGARTALGLGTMATQAASAVAVTGGTIAGITDLAIADGGTGASDPTTARTNLGAAANANTVTAGAGLTGGGFLGADPVLNVGTGDGIFVGVDSVSVDSTVVRTSGNQTIAGEKTYGNDARFNAGLYQGNADTGVAGSRGILAVLGTNRTDFLVKAATAESDSADMIRVMKGISTRFRVEADGDVTNTNNSYGAISDQRLKTDIEPAKDQLADIRQIGVVNYRLIETGERQVGVIAQDLQKIKPGLVVEGEDGFLSVKYSVLSVLLLKAVQELADKVDALEARLSGA